MFLIRFLFLSTSDRFIRFLEIIEWFIEWYFSVRFSLLFVFWIAVRWYETVNHYTFAVNLFCWVSSLLIIIVVPHITLCIWAFYGVYIVFYVVIWLVGLTALIGVTYVLACAFKDGPIWVRISTLRTFVWIAKFTYCVV